MAGNCNLARRGPLLVLLAIAVVFAGCGLFDIRDPMEPIGEIIVHTPNDPDSVILNFALGIENERGGIFTLNEALADTFLFKLSLTDAQASYGVNDIFLTRSETLDGWRSFISGAALRNEEFRIVFGPPDRVDPIVPGALVLWDEVPYELTTTMPAGGDSVATKAVIAQGTIDLYFAEKGGGNWAISRWEDHIDGSSVTFGARIETGSGHPRP
jgi:hypothetical protein